MLPKKHLCGNENGKKMKGRTNKITTRGSLKFYFQKGRYPRSMY
jgi:hypothetical protein